MSWIRGLAQRARALLASGRVDAELEEELRDHLQRESERQVGAGLSPAEARREASLRMGSLEAVKEAVRDVRGGRLLTDLVGDVRVASRWLRRNPGFTLAVVLSLGLGVGGTTAVFSVVRGVLLRPLPYPQADRLYRVRVFWNDFSANLSTADLEQLADGSRSIAEVGAFFLPPDGFATPGREGPEVLQGAWVTQTLPRVLAIPVLRGPGFSGDPDGREVLVSESLWQRRFGGAADVVGRTLALDGRLETVVGVVPAGFNIPGQRQSDVWVRWPRQEEPTRRGPFFLNTVARLGAGAAGADAAVRLTDRVAPRLRGLYGVDPIWRYALEPLQGVLVGNVRATLLLLFAAVGLVLVVAAVNVANLLLARSTARAPEMAVRTALGAARSRLARQLLGEAALLGSMGGAFGLGLAMLGLRLARDAASAFVPRIDEVHVDAAVASFALAGGVAAAVLAALVPAARLPWAQPAQSLREGSRTAGQGRKTGSARRLLVAAEMALTLTVLAGAALLVKSLVRLEAVPAGFEPQGVLSFRLALPDDPYADARRLEAGLADLESRLRRLPGVASVAFSNSLPPNLLQWSNNYTIEGSTHGSAGSSGVAEWLEVSGDYFPAMGIHLAAGRGFLPSDGPQAPPVALVNVAFVRRHLPDGHALGKRFKGGDWDPAAPWLSIVGVVADLPYAGGVWGGVKPTVYTAFAQSGSSQEPYVILKTAADPAAFASAARDAVRAVDPQLPLRDVATMAQRMRDSNAAPRFRSILFTILGVLALALAVTGVYGVTAYEVTQRRRETAIRLALGGSGRRVVAGILAGSVRLVAAGIAIGLGGAMALSHSLSRVLYGVAPGDLASLGVAACILATVALIGSWIPAFQAARVDPIAALREE
jgi:putative ABC transport system permease protein